MPVFLLFPYTQRDVLLNAKWRVLLGLVGVIGLLVLVGLIGVIGMENPNQKTP